MVVWMVVVMVEMLAHVMVAGKVAKLAVVKD